MQPQKLSPRKEGNRPNSAKSHCSIIALSAKTTSTRTPRRTVKPEKTVEEQKSYLSTQRCPRVEVVGYPQHPQHRKTYQYPRFPPHGCLVFSSACLCVLWLCSGRAVAARPGRLCPCRALRRAASAGSVSRSGGSERAGSSQPTSAGLEGKG